MARIYEKVLTVTSACDDCGQPIKLAYVIEWRSYMRELCYRCAEDIRQQLGKTLHAGRAPRRKKRKPVSPEEKTGWDDAT